MKGSIGVFDSGFGGLEILREIIKQLPQYDYLYLGDTARTPYGTRSQEIIYQFTRQAVDYLFKHNCQLIILACNTASSEALKRIQKEYLPKYYPHRKVLGVLIPASEEAIQVTKNHKIGVLATEGTVDSGSFNRELKKINPKVAIFQQSAPLLVPIVESGEHESPIAKLALKQYLQPLIDKNIDTLVLGCTHYGILEKSIKQIVGQSITLITEGKIVASKLKEYLRKHKEIDKKLKKTSQIKFLTTDNSNRFQQLGSLFFGLLIQPKQIILP